jgi:hypothetical protein
MKNFAATVIGTIGFFGMMALLLVVLGFYTTAFEAGAEEWFGWEGWWVPALFILAAVTFRSGLLFAIGMVIGGYGAYYAWDWPLWIVVPVFFPGLAFMIGGLFVALVGSTLEKVRG